MKPQTENLEIHKQKLYSAVLSDTLDSLGYLNQVLSLGIRPLDESSVLCGWARVGIYLPIYHDDELVKVYEKELKLIDSLQPDEVPVLICHGLKHIAPWGNYFPPEHVIYKPLAVSLMDLYAMCASYVR